MIDRAVMVVLCGGHYYTERFIALYRKSTRTVGYSYITRPSGRFENMFYAVLFKLNGHVYVCVMLADVSWSRVVTGKVFSLPVPVETGQTEPDRPVYRHESLFFFLTL
jgi:hypothetical protein